MPPTVAEINAVVGELWPASGIEPWDAPGFTAGRRDSEVRRIHLAVDAVRDTVDEAIAGGAGVLLVHHPLLLRGVTSIADDRYKGALLTDLIRADCALISAHTNADVVDTGTSAMLADRLGLTGSVPITPSVAGPGGIGRVGHLDGPTSLGRLARMLAELLPPTATGVRIAGEYERQVSTVAVCGGAGDSLLDAPAVRSADVYITSDLRHHPASEASEARRLGDGPALIDISHWASEWLWLEQAAGELRTALPGVEVVVSELRTDPWDFVVMQ